MSKLHGPVFGTAHTVAEVMENARRRVDTSVADAAKDQRIHDLEREVERLQSVVDGWTSAEAFNGWVADRADAERFRLIVMRGGYDLSDLTLAEAREMLDALGEGPAAE